MGKPEEHGQTAAEEAVLMAATKDAAAAAGGAGGRFGARFTRPRAVSNVIEVGHSPDVALELARRHVAETGSLIEDPNEAGDGAVWGLVASGAFGMAPALVRVVAEATAGGARVHVRATGREGLINQRIGGKAVDRICEAITGTAP